MTPEAQIQADVEALRQHATDTKDLYREVAALLFFRYGITPTANKLYQYVRKGSMSAPAEALAKFWDDLREKSRVRIEHPDLPDELKSAAGDLVATLWSQAQSAAQDALGAFRVEAETKVERARAAQVIAEQNHQVATQALNQCREAIANMGERALMLEREVAAERAAKESLLSQLSTTQRQREGLDVALVEARRDFAAELEKLREALNRSEERLEAAEKRALLELDRERMAANKAQKELTQLRESQARMTQGHREELTRLQSQLGEARQKVGAMEGSVQELRTILERQEVELQRLRAAGVETETTNALLRNELASAKARAAAAEEELRRAVSARSTSSKRRKKLPNEEES